MGRGSLFTIFVRQQTTLSAGRVVCLPFRWGVYKDALTDYVVGGPGSLFTIFVRQQTTLSAGRVVCLPFRWGVYKDASTDYVVGGPGSLFTIFALGLGAFRVLDDVATLP